MLIADGMAVDSKTKARRNAEYTEKLEQAERNYREGRVIVFKDNDWMSMPPEKLEAIAEEQRKHWK